MTAPGQAGGEQQPGVIRRTARTGWKFTKRVVIFLIALPCITSLLCTTIFFTSAFKVGQNVLTLFSQNKCTEQGGAPGGSTGGNAAVPDIVKNPPPALPALTVGGVTVGAEEVRNAWIIVDVAKQRGLPEKAWLIALVTAYKESTLRNLNYGNLDSLGLFQQRPSAGWGTPAEITDPWYAANTFFGGPQPPSPKGLVDVTGWENMEIHQAAEAVQHSGFPSAAAYNKFLGIAHATLAHIGAPNSGIALLGGVAVAGGSNCIGGIPGTPAGFTGAANAMVPDPSQPGKLVTAAAAHMYNETIRTFPGTKGFCLAQRPDNPLSDHPRGKACDFTIGAIGAFPSAEQKAEGWRIAHWLQANAAALNVKYLIWDGQTWNAGQPNWKGYTSNNCNVKTVTCGHFDHVHVSVTDGAPAAPPPPVQA
ncbi:MAG: hypothetical protein ACRDPW_10855 [Mycobacteriales bacterium]